MNPFRKSLTLERLEQRQLLAAVSIPTNLSGQVTALVSTPVSIDNAAGVRGASIKFTYDPSVLTLSQENVTLGSVWAGSSDAQLTTNINPTTGTVVVFVSASTALAAGSGTLLQLGFVVRSDATVGAASRVDLTEVRLNEGAISVSPVPVTGVDATDGTITVASGTPNVPGGTQLSGVVYADSNLDSSPGSTEGIPGVQLTLVNTSTGSSQQITTASDGSYQFTGLTAGSYRLVESQPNAFIEGGQNQIEVSLTTNQVLTSQNFREIGLKPQFVHNRFLTTLVMPVGSSSWQSAVSRIASLGSVSPALNALSTASSNAPVVTNNSVSIPLLAQSTMNTLPTSQAEGEGTGASGVRVLASQSTTVSTVTPMPQVARRTRVRGSSEIVDQALASLPAFE